MRRALHQVLSAVAVIIIMVLFMIGADILFKHITNSVWSFIILLWMAYGLIICIIGIRFINKRNRDLNSAEKYMMDEAHIRNVLHDWSHNKINTKQALQDIDSIYDHHYTDNIRIKDGDK